MTTNDAGLRDEILAELNADDELPPVDQPPPIPDRPADKLARADWVDYVVALGAGRDVAEDTRHWDDEADAYVTVPGLTVDDLVELADRLGG